MTKRLRCVSSLNSFDDQKLLVACKMTFSFRNNIKDKALTKEGKFLKFRLLDGAETFVGLAKLQPPFKIVLNNLCLTVIYVFRLKFITITKPHPCIFPSNNH